MKQKKHTSSNEKVFISFLASKKMRYTNERKAIFEELMKQQSHMDIDALYGNVKKIDKNIGIATIYRTLKILIEAGIIREVNISGHKTFYEAVIGRQHHDHLSCEICGENIEFKESNIEKLQEDIAKRYNYKLTGHALYLTGVCEKCRKNTLG